jgi:iron complex transport system substrate-binding protein
MRRTRAGAPIIPIAAFMLTAFIAAGCGPAQKELPAGKITVTDFRGARVALGAPASRIVCLIESALSHLYMLDAGDRVAGISTNIYTGDVFSFYASLDDRIKQKSVPAPGNWDFVSLESVIALAPDLVIIWADQREAVTALEERNIPVYAVMIRSFEDVFTEVGALGTLTGREERAEALVRYTKDELRLLKAGNGAAPPRVYFMWAQGMLETSGGTSTVNELIEHAGGINAFADVRREHMAVNVEELIARDPEVIVMWPNGRIGPGDVMGDARFAKLSAVKRGRVHEFPGVFLCDLWTLKFLHATRLAASWCRPEIHKAATVEKQKNEMLDYLYGGRLPR